MYSNIPTFVFTNIEEHSFRINIKKLFYDLKNIGLIYENPKGPADNLFPNIVKVLKNQKSLLKIYGKKYNTKDGTCVRDYVHVMDLADGHVKLLMFLNKFNGIETFNFGRGIGYTVLEIIRSFEDFYDINISYKITKKRKNDIPISFCNTNKAKSGCCK
jgi:UDP-glucose 4-epimerase